MSSKKLSAPIEESHTGEYMKLVAQYLEEYGPNTVVLYQTGHFLEMYIYRDQQTGEYSGSNCLEIAKLLDLKVANTNRVYIDPYTSQTKQIYMSGFTLEYSAEKHIQRLQELKYTVVIYLQEPQNEPQNEQTSKSKKKTHMKRYLHSIVSPGTHLITTESNEVITALSNNIVCVWIDYKKPSATTAFKMTSKQNVYIAVAMVNIFTGDTSIFQYSDTAKDLRAYDELDNFLFINRPNEIIFIHNIDIDPLLQYLDLPGEPLVRIVDMSNTASTNTKRALNAAKQVYQTEVVRKFYGNAEKANAVFSDIAAYALATQAFVYLLEDIFKHNPNLVKQLRTPVFENHSTSLMLPNHSLKQLNILDDGITSHDATTSKYSCVANFLNLCITPMGKRHFMHTLLHPSYPTTDEQITRLQAEYDITEAMLDSVIGYTHAATWRAALFTIKDLAKYERQILNRKTPPATFYHIHTTLENTRTLVNIIRDLPPNITRYFENIRNINISDIFNAIAKIDQFIQTNLLIESAGNISNTRSVYDTPFMASTASPAIKVVTENYNTTNNRLLALKVYFDSLVTGCDDAVILNETDKEGIITLVATSRRCCLINAALPKNTTLLEDANIPVSKSLIQFTKTTAKDTTSNKSRIHSPDIDALCENARIYKKDMADITTVEYGRFITEFEKDYLDLLAQITHFITICDMIYSKAEIAYKYGYCKPVIATGDIAHVKTTRLRHPLIEQILNSTTYVPNDLTLGADQTTQGYLLYGTNMVGKTSFIKSVGIAVIMAQAGLYVPASTFEFIPYQYIFTRILGTDNLFKGQSTFATEMLELRTILNLANQYSLVLGDELCAGTETASAIGIFMAGIRHLYQANASFLFATHLHEIMEFPDYLALMPRLRACHMRVHYDRATDTLVYDRDMCDGSGDTMYGLEVCAYLKMPDAFLQQAYQYRTDFITGRAPPDILSLKPSRYNSGKLKGGVCEKCGVALSTEIHHLAEQHTANAAGLVITPHGAKIHKNHIANLSALCEACHLQIHHAPGP